jgi:3-methyladenine DNA glycosylase Tag
VISFEPIRGRAEARKGGPAALGRLLPPKPDSAALAALKDDRVLAEMTQRVFSAGFAWSVIESKWPGFEQAFQNFEPAKLAFEPDEFWEALTKDARIVRNAANLFGQGQRKIRPRRGEGARKLRRLPRQMAVLR